MFYGSSLFSNHKSLKIARLVLSLQNDMNLYRIVKFNGTEKTQCGG